MNNTTKEERSYCPLRQAQCIGKPCVAFGYRDFNKTGPYCRYFGGEIHGDV